MMPDMTAVKPSALKKWFAAFCLAIAVAANSPGTALASSSDDEESKVYDARLQGYDKNIQLDSGSTALSWLLLAALGVMCMAVLFKDAKRTHLD